MEKIHRWHYLIYKGNSINKVLETSTFNIEIETEYNFFYVGLRCINSLLSTKVNCKKTNTDVYVNWK